MFSEAAPASERQCSAAGVQLAGDSTSAAQAIGPYTGDDYVPDDTAPVVRLFAQEVPEIAAGSIEIKAIARKPGYRSKLALHSQDPRVDCIGTCVGVRGFRIKNIVDALGGERIDLIRWHDSPEQLIVNALQPALIERVLLYPAEYRAVVVVKPDQVSLVLGRRGENRQLASELSGWQIDVEEV
jgi:N utilization substance protein A